MLAERLNRRQWLMEQNSHLISHLFNQFQPVDSSIPLPRTCPSAFLDSNTEVESGQSQNNSSLASSFSYRPTCGIDGRFQRFQHPPSAREASSKVTFQHKTNTKNNVQSKKRCYSGWDDGSSQFDSIGSTTPSLHRIPENFKEANNRGTLFEGDSGYSRVESSDVDRNSGFTGSDRSRRCARGSATNLDISRQDVPPASFCSDRQIQRIDRHVFPVI